MPYEIQSSRERDPKILVIDDSPVFCDLVTRILHRAGFRQVVEAHRVSDALAILTDDFNDRPAEATEDAFQAPGTFDLILLDVELPDLNGIEACRRLKAEERFRDLPVLMVTSHTDPKLLAEAFAAGAMDYLTKPIERGVFLARIHSALRLKYEIDERRDRERRLRETTRQLEEANRRLLLLAEIDELTELANRRKFNQTLNREWRRNLREQGSLALILADIDCFKDYNDRYGHQRGDVCLQRVATVVGEAARRASDLACRWGGEEFALIFPGVDIEQGRRLADELRQQIERLDIEHEGVPTHRVTISLGVAASIPQTELRPSELLGAADRALYKAKQNGRNRVETSAAMAPTPSAIR